MRKGMTDNTVKIFYEKCTLTLRPRIHYLLPARDLIINQKRRQVQKYKNLLSRTGSFMPSIQKGEQSKTRTL